MDGLFEDALDIIIDLGVEKGADLLRQAPEYFLKTFLDQEPTLEERERWLLAVARARG